MLHVTILTSIAVAAVAAFVTWYLTRRFISHHYDAMKSLDFEQKKNVLISETRDALVLSADFAARLDNEYRRGKEDGQKEELAKLTIVYEPYQTVVEEYFGIKKRAEIGYSMQLHYAGLPIGDPTHKALHTNVEFDEAKIEKMMTSDVMGTINNLCSMLITRGIPGKILPRKF